MAWLCRWKRRKQSSCSARPAEVQVRIEPQAERHAEDLFAALQAPELHEFLGSAPPASVEEVRQRILRQNRGPRNDSGDIWLNWIVLVDNDIAGITQSTITPDGTANLAYVLSPAFWGRSLGYEACRLTLLELSKMKNVKSVVADTERGNLRSAALLMRLGFKQVREIGDDVFYDGGDIQTLVRQLK